MRRSKTLDGRGGLGRRAASGAAARSESWSTARVAFYFTRRELPLLATLLAPRRTQVEGSRLAFTSIRFAQVGLAGRSRPQPHLSSTYSA